MHVCGVFIPCVRCIYTSENIILFTACVPRLPVDMYGALCSYMELI